MTFQATGGFSAGVVNRGSTAGSGTLLLQATANSANCTSSPQVITSDTQSCPTPLLPQGSLQFQGGAPAPTLVQSNSQYDQRADVTSATLTLAQTTTAGDLLVMGIAYTPRNAQPTITLADGTTNVWSASPSDAYADSGAAIYYVSDAAAVSGGITVSFSSPVRKPSLFFYEFSGARAGSPLDTSGSNSSSSQAAISVAASAPTAVANEVAVAVVSTASGDSLPSPPWTNQAYGNAAYATVVASGSTASFSTTTLDSFAATIASFEPTLRADPLSGAATLTNTGSEAGAASLTPAACGPLGALDASPSASNPGLLESGVVENLAGPLPGSGAMGFSGNQMINTTTSYFDPNPVSEATWFKTTSSGTLMGASNAQGNTGQSNWDRQIWVDNSGYVVFGVYNGGFYEAKSSSPYNDGKWHLVVATIGSNGMQLYIDDTLVGSNPQATTPQNYSAYWHLGWDSEANNWPDAPSSSYFVGDLADAAVFPGQLSASQAGSLWSASGSQTAYAAGVDALSPTSFWPLQDNGYLYPDAISGSSPSQVCRYVGVTMELSGASPRCLLPASPGSCPALDGSSDSTLSGWSSVLSLGNLAPGGAAAVVIQLVLEGTPPAVLQGLQPSLSVTAALSNASWSASVLYGDQQIVLG